MSSGRCNSLLFTIVNAAAIMKKHFRTLLSLPVMHGRYALHVQQAKLLDSLSNAVKGHRLGSATSTNAATCWLIAS